jgi:TM2 domain-containing membrane protein YozV
MKKYLKTSVLSISLLLVIVSSCTIEKRHYMPGYHVNRIANRPTTIAKASNDNLPQQLDYAVVGTENIKVEEPIFLASDDAEIIIPTESEKLITLSIPSNNPKKPIVSQENECDVIIFRNGDEILAKVLEVNQNEVKYITCENNYAQTIIVNTREIFKIKYINGTSMVFDESTSQKSFNINDPLAIDSDNPNDRSLVVAVVLWALFGLIGIHRFYLGHIGIGILYALTGGLCGIGWIIDGILFLTGALQPKNGRYVD